MSCRAVISSVVEYLQTCKSLKQDYTLGYNSPKMGDLETLK